LEVNSSIFKLRALPLLGGVNPQDVKNFSLGGFCVGRQTLISVLLLFRYFIRACYANCKRTKIVGVYSLRVGASSLWHLPRRYLNFYLPRRLFDFRLRDHRKDPVNFASFISDIYFRADLFCDFTPQIFQRTKGLSYLRFHRSGTCEHLCRSSRR